MANFAILLTNQMVFVCFDPLRPIQLFFKVKLTNNLYMTIVVDWE